MNTNSSNCDDKSLAYNILCGLCDSSLATQLQLYRNAVQKVNHLSDDDMERVFSLPSICRLLRPEPSLYYKNRPLEAYLSEPVEEKKETCEPTLPTVPTLPKDDLFGLQLDEKSMKTLFPDFQSTLTNTTSFSGPIDFVRLTPPEEEKEFVPDVDVEDSHSESPEEEPESPKKQLKKSPEPEESSKNEVQEDTYNDTDNQPKDPIIRAFKKLCKENAVDYKTNPFEYKPTPSGLLVYFDMPLSSIVSRKFKLWGGKEKMNQTGTKFFMFQKSKLRKLTEEKTEDN